MRRARKGGDGWGAGEPPHETPERYRIVIRSGGDIVRTWDAGPAPASYASALIATDFPDGGEGEVGVSQLGADDVPGAPARISVMFPAP